MQTIPKGMYQHYKGGNYTVLFCATHSENLEEYVVYTHIENDSVAEYWIRPVSMFLEMIHVNGEQIPRFKKID